MRNVVLLALGLMTREVALNMCMTEKAVRNF